MFPSCPPFFDVSPFGVVVYKAIFVILRKFTYDFTLIVCSVWERGLDVWSNCGVGRKNYGEISGASTESFDAMAVIAFVFRNCVVVEVIVYSWKTIEKQVEKLPLNGKLPGRFF